jgi:hypothetical protein
MIEPFSNKIPSVGPFFVFLHSDVGPPSSTNTHPYVYCGFVGMPMRDNIMPPGVV